MKRSRTALFALAFLSALLPVFASAQNAISGTWSIEPASRQGKIELDLRTDDEFGRGHSHDSSQYTAQDIGLQPSDLSSPAHPVHFTMRRDAGTIDFTGTAGDGVGAGHFTFTPSAAYGDALAKRGFDRPSAREQLAATTLDISVAYIDAIAATGVRPSSYGNLIAFRALGVTPEGIRDLRRQFGNVDEGNVITFTALHITPQYAAEMRAAGVSDLDPHTLVSLRALHVDAAYIKELASAGYSNLTGPELEQLKAMNVDASYIRRVRAHGYKHPTVRQLIELKAMKIL
jgi:hypothetical protein